MKPVYYIIAAIFLIPAFLFILTIIKKTKKRHRLLKTLQRLSALLNTEIKDCDICDDLAIGFDVSSEYLLFFREGKVENTSRFIRLAEIQSCRIINTYRDKQEETGYSAYSEKLVLSITPFDKNRTAYHLEFKESTEKTISFKKFMLAYKWWRLINEEMNRQKS